MKPLGKKAYGSIPHLPGSRLGPGDHHCEAGQARIACEKARDKHDVVIVQEKLDGSNVAVAKLNGEIIALTRAGYTALSSPHLQHHLFQNWVEREKQRFIWLLNEGERVCGEWLAMAHGTQYDLTHEPFVPFDIMLGNSRFSWSEFERRVRECDFTPPALLHHGSPYSIQNALYAIRESAHGAIDPVEGAIWRIERRGVVDFLCKYVRPEKEDGKYFAEITGKDPVWNITEKYFKDLSQSIENIKGNEEKALLQKLKEKYEN